MKLIELKLEFHDFHFNRRGVRVPPPRLLTGKFLLTYQEKREKRQGKKGKGVKIEKKRRKIVKGKVEKLQSEKRPFYFIYFLLLLLSFFLISFYLILFYFFASHFSKTPKFVLGLPNWKFSTVTLPLQKHFPVTALVKHRSGIRPCVFNSTRVYRVFFFFFFFFFEIQTGTA